MYPCMCVDVMLMKSALAVGQIGIKFYIAQDTMK